MFRFTKPFNKNLKTEHFSLLRIEEIMDKMLGETIFSRYDAKKRFYHFSLSKESSKLTTFNTPIGIYCFCKLPYEIVAPDIFYKHFSRLLEGLEGVQTYIYVGNIIVTGKVTKSIG